jgi:hypothetical protein
MIVDLTEQGNKNATVFQLRIVQSWPDLSGSRFAGIELCLIHHIERANQAGHSSDREQPILARVFFALHRRDFGFRPVY